MGQDGHAQTSTTVGRFVIQTIEKHISYGRYALWSGIEWGTEIQRQGDTVMVKHRGVWKKLTSVNSLWAAYAGNQRAVLNQILDYARQLYPAGGFPSRWIFNDFGHVSVKYLKDTNNDRKMNGNEHVIGDFIHTTPFDEAFTAQKRSFTLAESHGCILVKPLDIDTMIGNGYLKKGQTVEVHSYNEKALPANLKRTTDGKPYEVHFFRALLKLAVYKP
ncbi:hypothetical protein [Pedobacter sp. SYP-B3415]|uniref:hypothetical protein n=1 Tax=Pedobacter sp. SYP-B3415 TaxID=2496641 RepID=UPI00101C2164|nr:hypothetical protein [Pedobacter sp. SYP-B3415]